VTAAAHPAPAPASTARPTGGPPAAPASVIHERLVAEHGVEGRYQRVKLCVAEARQRLAKASDSVSGLPGLHRRFKMVAGAQARVDWGDEGAVLLDAGIARVYSFHMTLSYSRDPFCCFTTSQDLGTFFDCHRRAFAHIGGLPGASSPTVDAPVARACTVLVLPRRDVGPDTVLVSSTSATPPAWLEVVVGDPGRVACAGG
jgi:transposase